eukprot:4617257-Pyramimonas_sp.AAC.1
MGLTGMSLMFPSSALVRTDSQDYPWIPGASLPPFEPRDNKPLVRGILIISSRYTSDWAT